MDSANESTSQRAQCNILRGLQSDSLRSPNASDKIESDDIVYMSLFKLNSEIFCSRKLVTVEGNPMFFSGLVR